MSSAISGREARVHAFCDDALGDHDAVGLAEELRTGRVSRAEVVEAAITRTEAVDKQLGAVAYADYERAREESWRKGGGFFSGVPTIVKDNCDVAGLPTQHGTTAFVARPAREHGDWARLYLGQGLVNLGKSRLSEFGFNGSAEFPEAEPVRNPWNPAHSSGASSAGSAVLVAAGAVPIAHANDGGGSIRIPAGCCGLVGLKPTRGRVPGDRMSQEMPVRIVADGVVTRSVRDTAAFLREAERTRRAHDLRPVGDVRGPGRRRLTVALVTESVIGTVDEESLAVVRQAGAVLEDLGHRVVPAPPPVTEQFVADFLLYWATLAAGMAVGGKVLLNPSFRWRRTDNLTRGLARYAARNAHRIPGAITRLRGARRESADFYRRYDVALTPTTGHVTPPLGHLSPAHSYEQVIGRLMEWVIFTPLQNATGDPAVSLPLGRSSSTGLPIGAHLAAGWGREARLLELAYELEEARPFARIDR